MRRQRKAHARLSTVPLGRRQLVAADGGLEADMGIQIGGRATPPILAARYTANMRNEFTAIIEKDGDWFIARCPEVPGANGQGRTIEEVKDDLAAAIELVLDVLREDALGQAPPDAVRDTVVVG